MIMLCRLEFPCPCFFSFYHLPRKLISSNGRNILVNVLPLFRIIILISTACDIILLVRQVLVPQKSQCGSICPTSFKINMGEWSSIPSLSKGCLRTCFTDFFFISFFFFGYSDGLMGRFGDDS